MLHQSQRETRAADAPGIQTRSASLRNNSVMKSNSVNEDIKTHPSHSFSVFHLNYYNKPSKHTWSLNEWCSQVRRCWCGCHGDGGITAQLSSCKLRGMKLNIRTIQQWFRAQYWLKTWLLTVQIIKIEEEEGLAAALIFIWASRLFCNDAASHTGLCDYLYFTRNERKQHNNLQRDSSDGIELHLDRKVMLAAVL